MRFLGHPFPLLLLSPLSSVGSAIAKVYYGVGGAIGLVQKKWRAFCKRSVILWSLRGRTSAEHVSRVSDGDCDADGAVYVVAYRAMMLCAGLAATVLQPETRLTVGIFRPQLGTVCRPSRSPEGCSDAQRPSA